MITLKKDIWKMVYYIKDIFTIATKYLQINKILALSRS